MIRQAVANVLLQLLALVCQDHVPTVHTDPIRCAICWRMLGSRADQDDE